MERQKGFSLKSEELSEDLRNNGAGKEEKETLDSEDYSATYMDYSETNMDYMDYGMDLATDN